MPLCFLEVSVFIASLIQIAAVLLPKRALDQIESELD